jgi:hypothetical protein
MTVCNPNVTGWVTNGADCNDTDPAVSYYAVELCDGKDNNCNGLIDEGFVKGIWFEDKDGDGWGNPNSSLQSCLHPDGYVNNDGDCDDNEPHTYPVSEEICDGKDNNCNGEIDEGLALRAWYHDNDGDGYGNAADSKSACSQPPGYVANNEDCDDSKTFVFPGANEICSNKIDDDCDGQTDEGCDTTPGISITDIEVYENSGIAELTVTLSHPVAETVRLSADAVEGTATGKGKDKDYKAHKEHVSISPGSTVAVIAITINNDNIQEGDEYFDIVLSRPVGASIEKGTGRVVIKDGSPLTRMERQVKSGLSLQAYPNPSQSDFYVKVESGSDAKAQLRVLDVVGRVVEIFDIVGTNRTLHIGATYRPGIYLLQFIQAKTTKELKLVKQ